jgi:hypothetical protein
LIRGEGANWPSRTRRSRSLRHRNRPNHLDLAWAAILLNAALVDFSFNAIGDLLSRPNVAVNSLSEHRLRNQICRSSTSQIVWHFPVQYLDQRFGNRAPTYRAQSFHFGMLGRGLRYASGKDWPLPSPYPFFLFHSTSSSLIASSCGRSQGSNCTRPQAHPKMLRSIRGATGWPRRSRCIRSS